MTRARRALAATVAVAAITLSGCGIEERIVHLQPAPTENAEVGAPLRMEAAEQISARVLAQAAEATTSEERQAVLVGPALRVAEARVAREGTAQEAVGVTTPEPPTILAMSRGQEWPRAMLVATLEPTTSTQLLHVLVSSGPTERFTVYATATMLPGSSVPGLGEASDGTPFSRATEEAPIEASAVVAEYAKALAFPDPGESDVVALEDTFAQSLRDNAAAQDESFDDLADLERSHTPIADSIVSFETVDGGRIVFGQLTRTTVITLTEEAKELKIDDPALQELSGKEVVTDSFTTEHLENLVFIAPAEGPASLIGAEEVLLRAEGS